VEIYGNRRGVDGRKITERRTQSTHMETRNAYTIFGQNIKDGETLT
jgi:hypothetical protein